MADYNHLRWYDDFIMGGDEMIRPTPRKLSPTMLSDAEIERWISENPNKVKQLDNNSFYTANKALIKQLACAKCAHWLEYMQNTGERMTSSNVRSRYGFKHPQMKADYINAKLGKRVICCDKTKQVKTEKGVRKVGIFYVRRVHKLS